MGEYPKIAPPPEPGDFVQVLMTERQARRFEELCLYGEWPDGTKVALRGPLIFADDDLPTYIIG